VLLHPEPASPQARELARSLGITITLADVLHRRGHDGGDRTRRFLEPKLSELTSPKQMAGRAEAVERIGAAVRRREKTVVFGDYDCDGITSAAILTEVIGALGGDALPLLADRFEGGYGLTELAVDRILLAHPTLVITCDCGTSDHDRLQRLARSGVDVVVIDHHLVPEEPVPAVAFLNPNRPDCAFGYKHLASCGLALSLAAGLRAELGSNLDVRNWLDLVAIGTVADVAPLDGDNRALVRAGMRYLEAGTRLGLRWLADLAKVALDAGVTSETISFDIAPRLNAPGRLGSPMPALELLLARTHEQARERAAAVEGMRMQRRQMQDKILSEALAEIDASGFASDPAIVIGREGWSHGIVGIVAANLVDRFHKPAVVIGFDGEQGRGSVRGPEGQPLYDFLKASQDAPITFGGHQAAAGVQVRRPALERLRELFNAAALTHARLPGSDTAASSGARAEVLLHEADRANDVVTDLSRLEPCGISNPSPSMAVLGATVAKSQMVRGGHLQVTLQTRAGDQLHGFGSLMGSRAAGLPASMRVDVIGRLRRDTWRGGHAVALRVEAIEPASETSLG